MMVEPREHAEGDVAPAVATRCGFVALIGAPNVGKSTLVNALVGSKVTIVSRKVQTTRALIRGIVIDNNAQIILVDTPGIFMPKRRLDRAMVSTAWTGAHDADLVCVLLDAREGIDEEAEAIFAKVATVNHPKLLVINKVDIVDKEKLLKLAQAANERLKFAETFMVSAMTGDGVDDLRHTLAAMVPPGPYHYPEDQMSDAPMRHLAAEITREKIFRQLHQELPYQSTVETDSWTERKDKSIRIEQTIFRRARKPAQDRARQGRRHHQVDRRGFAQGDRRDRRRARAPVPVRQGARKLGRRSQPLPRNGPRIPEGIAGVAMTVPRNVLWFEVLLYLSLTLDALSVAFRDRTPTAQMTESMIMMESLFAAGLLLLLVYFVRLAARQRKNWPRWILSAALALSVITLVQVIGARGLEFSSAVEVVSCALTAAGLFFSFTGDARDWFNA